MREVGESLALTHTFNQSATGEAVSDAPVPRVLPVENVLRRDSGRKPAWTDYLYSAGELPDEDGASVSIVTVSYCVKNRFAHRTFTERRHVKHEQPVLVVLLVVAQVHKIPETVVKEQKPLAKFLSLIGGTDGF